MRYLIFGGTGSLGKKLIERLSLDCHEVSVYSRDEMKHWAIRNDLLSSASKKPLPRFFVGDIRDKERVKSALRQANPDVVIVAAALKQVDTCELSPYESVQTNLLGTQNVISSINDLSFVNKTLLFVSTDKACSPVNTYGMCKAISERLVSSQSMFDENGNKYLCTRYGNVLESRGSIIPLFRYQAENCESLTVTDPNMTRFMMTLDESVDLIQDAIANGRSGETWIPRLPSMRIGDLAEIFAERFNKIVRVVGLRPGEKQHEDLVNRSESVRTRALSNSRYVMLPAHVTCNATPFTYTSADDVMTRQQLLDYLTSTEIIDRPLHQFPGAKIEEIDTSSKT